MTPNWSIARVGVRGGVKQTGTLHEKGEYIFVLDNFDFVLPLNLE